MTAGWQLRETAMPPDSASIVSLPGKMGLARESAVTHQGVRKRAACFELKAAAAALAASLGLAEPSSR